ncbi:MAG: ImmA/IrrE family metallo-endopeptidase [Planctomycetota bacterium]|nr:ImmA/IrrE family metallo-endopeptidase [Planctomycetota bacterium]
MSQANPMQALYRRLSQVGLSRKFVRETGLPGWWDDEIAANPAGLAQGLLLLSRHLGVELASLQDPAAPIVLRKFGVCKYKKREGVSEEDLALARVIATRAAQLVAEAITAPACLVPSDASEIRQTILDGGAPWVGLAELVDFCWSVGIPVLHVNQLPGNARRPDGFAARVNGRGVIVLCRRDKHSAWLLFILAHELGHLALGHIPQDGTLIDDHVDESGGDTEERDANAFAIELLAGNSERRYAAGGRWPNAAQLADVALQLGRRQMVDPGHIALNYAHSMGKEFFPVGRAALNILAPNSNAIALVRDRLAASLDWSLIPEDSSEFLARVTECGSER